MTKLIQRTLLAVALCFLFACESYRTPDGDLEAGGDWTSSGGDSWTPDGDNGDAQDDDDTSGDDDDTSGDDDTSSDDDDVDLLQEAKESLVGFYAMRARVARIQELPVFGETPAVTVSLGISEIYWQGGDLMLSEIGCHVEVDSDSVETIIPDAIPQSTPARVARINVFENDNGSFSWTRDRMSMAVGVTLEDANSEALPTSSDDERVFDQDNDGQPGITIFVNAMFSGEVYAVQRQRDEYVEGVVEEGELSALITDTSEQSVIGASIFALDTNLVQSNDPDESKSFIVMKHLDSVLTCDELFPLLDTIFIE